MAETLLLRGVFVTHRQVTGAPVAADPAISAAFPRNRQGLIRDDGYKVPIPGIGTDDVLGIITFTGGAAPTVDLEYYIYDEGTDTFSLVGSSSGLADEANFRYNSSAALSFIRIAAVTGAPTEVLLRVAHAGTSSTGVDAQLLNPLKRYVDLLNGSDANNGAESSPKKSLEGATAAFVAPPDADTAGRAHIIEAIVGRVAAPAGGTWVLRDDIPCSGLLIQTEFAISGSVRWEVDETKFQGATPSWIVGGGYDRQGMQITGGLNIKRNDGGPANITITSVAKGLGATSGITETGLLAGDIVNAFWENVAFGAIVATHLIIDELIGESQLTGDVTVEEIRTAEQVVFGGDITVATASVTAGRRLGYFNCKFTKSGPVFTGPAGSAKFDHATAASFIAQGGTFTGGAGPADYLYPDAIRLLTRAITPAAFTGDVNDWNPTGLSTTHTIRADPGAADQTITGLVAQVNGFVAILENVGTAGNKFVLPDEDALSAAANRFVTPSGGSVDVVQGASVVLRYDGTSARWRFIGKVTV